ncbi:ATPase [Hansschlegelia quercus]|uniref:ATPase n=1 Tax=Hansschlegelia quercus TaxID=2528245 RepID=A0A4Q9GK97_9HYPH|nr:ATPase [Hansschlegelia quercus]TBN52497.1 ATPase [Hansschlegelia quercus]
MSAAPKLKIAPGVDGVSIWSDALFRSANADNLRQFVSRAFSVPDVSGVEIRPDGGFARLSYAATRDAAAIWRRLNASLRGAVEAPHDASGLFLNSAAPWPIRVTKVGDVLSTWRMRSEGQDHLRVAHPILRGRRDVAFRLEEVLAEIVGVEEFRSSRLTGGVRLRFDASVLTLSKIARELEAAWPRVLSGIEGPPAKTRLYAAGGLLALAAAGQFAIPALRPVAVAGVALFSAPNVALAARQLRHGQVGLPALYSTGLAFLFITGLPLTGTIMALLMQLWPHLAERTIIDRQRKLFATRRKRHAWARLPQDDGVNVEIHVDDLKPGDLVVVRRGEFVPVDGVVTEGVAAIVDALANDPDGDADLAPGDPVNAGAFLRDGEVVIRVRQSGSATAAAHIAKSLPHAFVDGLPSSAVAELVANRNAKPALALSALSFLATGVLRPSQAVIRPDYATAPRISAQFSALYDLAKALDHGLFFRNPAALDKVGEFDLFVFDDSAALDRRAVAISNVLVNGASDKEILAYAAVGFPDLRSERGRAIRALLESRSVTIPGPETLRRAGAVVFRDDVGQTIELLSPARFALSKLEAPARLEAAAARATSEGQPKPLWVVRDGSPIGLVTFGRSGAPEAEAVIRALKAKTPSARFVYVSRRAEAVAQTIAAGAGIEHVASGLTARKKAAFIRSLPRAVVWIGDGSHEDSREAMTASAVSVSLAGLSSAPGDNADIQLLKGRLSGLLDLADLGAAHRRRLKADYKTVYAANLLAVAGTFLAGFGSLRAGLFSNLGTAVVYAQHIRQLDALVQEREGRDARLRSSIHH